ncbi:MAG: chromosome partitioning protein ParB, partial [Gammaproteobacteria bacterium]|nr:chromosome partitioning protein ParB [Gammaproteobacteria bacterium]
MARSRLGRSLGDLLSSALTVEKVEKTESAISTVETHLQELAITAIEKGQFQPRREINDESIEELAASIRTHGILQPILVRPIAEHRYEIIAGERRFLAAQLAGLSQVPVVIKTIDDQSTMALALIENMQRENLSPLDEALAIERLIDDCQLTHDDAAHLLGKSRAQISNLLRLLNLEPQVKQWVAEKKLELGHAKVLLALNGRQQLQAAEKVMTQNLTVRQTEALVAQIKAPAVTVESAPLAPELQALQSYFSALLATKARLKPGKNGQGKLVLLYK